MIPNLNKRLLIFPNFKQQEGRIIFNLKISIYIEHGAHQASLLRVRHFSWAAVSE